MNTLLIDAGNSHLKWATLDGGILSDQHSLSYQDKSPIERIKEVIEVHHADADSIIMVSVLGDDFANESKKIAKSKKLSLINVESKDQIASVKNAYDEPHKLGADRLVAMIAAYDLVNHNKDHSQACIVIDIGTATTIDAVDANGQHLGGVILSGLHLCSEGLLKDTKLLPLWNQDNKEFTPEVLAKNTTQAIASGCLFGLAGGIDSICNRIERELKKNSNDGGTQINKIICGGAAEKLLPYMQGGYHYHENLLMLGLKVIKEDSVKNV